ncbi:MAG: hypothetical protein ACRCT8_13005 [Lacipirellulaceae bacterium]
MTTLRLINAATLALANPERGWLADDEPTAALFSVAADRPAVALSRLRTLGQRLAPRLALHADLRLLVTTGMTPPDDAALALAEGLGDAGATVPIAAIKGEDLRGAFEELLAAGAERAERDSWRVLRESAARILAAWSFAPPSAIAAPLNAGARCVLLRGASLSDLGAAAAAHHFGEPCDGPTAAAAAKRARKAYAREPQTVQHTQATERLGPAPTSAGVSDSAEVDLFVTIEAGHFCPLITAAFDALDRIDVGLRTGVERVDGLDGPGIASRERESLEHTVRLIELTMERGPSPWPLERAIAPTYISWPTQVGRDFIESEPLGFALHQAKDWLA